jgi:hypothetical protein
MRVTLSPEHAGAVAHPSNAVEDNDGLGLDLSLKKKKKKKAAAFVPVEFDGQVGRGLGRPGGSRSGRRAARWRPSPASPVAGAPLTLCGARDRPQEPEPEAAPEDAPAPVGEEDLDLDLSLDKKKKKKKKVGPRGRLPVCTLA